MYSLYIYQHVPLHYYHLLTTHVVSRITTTTTMTSTTPIAIDLIRSVDRQLLADELDRQILAEEIDPSCEVLAARKKERVSQYCDNKLAYVLATKQKQLDHLLCYYQLTHNKKVRWADGCVDSDLGSTADTELDTIPDSVYSWDYWNSRW
ncbi:hypothetical protein BGX38DRAFT_280524 [Terfezia claveryi]|nr:hypothetical protein BGX38DRAFT_280524 [Terfezia claveryi]